MIGPLVKLQLLAGRRGMYDLLMLLWPLSPLDV
jgi:hypothetical protein